MTNGSFFFSQLRGPLPLLTNRYHLHNELFFLFSQLREPLPLPLLANRYHPYDELIFFFSLSYAEPLKTVSEEWRAGLVILYAVATALSIGGNAVVIFVLTFSKR